MSLAAPILISAAPTPVLSFADPQPSPATATDWQTTARDDLRFYEQAIRDNYIYAVYPKPAEWNAAFERILADVRAELPSVHDKAGYQALLKYLSVSFHDAHMGILFAPPAPDTRWPGFLARFDNGAYRVTAARAPGVVDGAEVTACDGKPIGWWVSTIARYELAEPVTLETTRMNAALRLYVDRGSPLRPHPSSCVIAGRDVTLDWRTAPGDIEATIAFWRGRPSTREVSTRSIGKDGAWVKLGYFQPESAAEAAAFHAAIAAAPKLRDRRFIILDVRGNGGGPYNWFMGYLRGLYGRAYADHYATARLHIRAVYRLSRAAQDDGAADEAAASAFKRPADPPYEANDRNNDKEEARATAAGEPYFRALAPALPHGAAPPDPVRAHVYVLTDYGCGSACIGFVDELKLFPGVRQIGLPTTVDSRSGTAVPVKLPSGNGTLYIAAMTRDGRVRGDNVPQVPSIRFTGDIRDDTAVEDWVLHSIVGPQPHNRKRGKAGSNR